MEPYQPNRGSMAKITKATFKSFVKKNVTNLHIMTKSRFDGMIDGLAYNDKPAFERVVVQDMSDRMFDNNLGINGIWLVGNSRDYFDEYEDDKMVGIKVFNCCGSFVVATKK